MPKHRMRELMIFDVNNKLGDTVLGTTVKGNN